MSPDSATYLSIAGLKARGWTAGLIIRLLGAPDATSTTPHYASVPPMRLYLVARVEACEQRPDWEALRAPIARRQAAASRAVATKRQQVQDYLDHLLIVVPRWPDDELVALACAHYNQRQAEASAWYAAKHQGAWDGVCWEPASAASSPAFLARISANYLRHMCSIYEDELRHFAGKAGVANAVRVLHAKVCSAIGEAYPALAEECARQVAVKAGEEVAS